MSCCSGRRKLIFRIVIAILIALVFKFRRPVFNSIFGDGFIPTAKWREPFYNAINYNNVPVFDINLDLPMKERYAELIKHYKGTGLETLIYDHVIHNVTATLGVPKIVVDSIFEGFLLLYPFYKDQEVKDFIDFLSKEAEIPKRYIFALNFLYELVHFMPLWPMPEATYCTGVIATNSNGNTMHGRNLDFGFPESLSKMHYVSRNFKKGKLVYVGLEILGYHGLLQGYKPELFSLSINARKAGSSITENMWNIFVDHRISGTKLLRKTLELASDYNHAKKMLETEKIMSPLYYVMAGNQPYQGLVMTRNADKVVLLKELKKDETWYICQTNWDLNLPDPAWEPRRTRCEERMEKLTQSGVNEETMMTLLNMNPTFNNIRGWTITSQVFNAKDKYFNYTMVDWNNQKLKKSSINFN